MAAQPVQVLDVAFPQGLQRVIAVKPASMRTQTLALVLSLSRRTRCGIKVSAFLAGPALPSRSSPPSMSPVSASETINGE